MIDTQDLLNALYQKHMATAALVAAFPGGCHIEIAPNAASGAYLVLEVVSSSPDHAYGTATTLAPIIAFKAVGTGRTETAAALALWTAILDNPANDITGSYSRLRMGGMVPTYIGPSEAHASKDAWQQAVSYQFSTN